MSGPGSAAQSVRDIIEASRYLVLATSDARWILAKDGQPDHRVPVPLRGHGLVPILAGCR
jgi:hypothetical protein